MSNEDKGKIPALRTLKTDTAEFVQKGVSLVDIAAEEAKRGGLKYEEKTKKFPLRKIILIAVMIVIIVGIGLVGFWFWTKNQQEKQGTQLLAQPILVAEDQIEIVPDAKNPQKFLNNLQNTLQSQIRPNHLLNVFVALDSREFLKTIGANPPPEFLYSLDSKFMLAKFYLTKDWPILLFKIRDYDSAFAGIIKWERFMAADLQGILLLPNLDNINNFFEDKVIQNHDTRVLNDKNGNSLLLYSFINRNYLVLTTNEEPLKEIFRRFSLPQYLNE
jgi:hypothetical protein